MAVYKRGYEPYEGRLTPQRWRFLIIARYAWRSLSNSRWLLIYLVLCSHLLRDVEETCEEVLILKQGRIVHYANLDQERRLNRKFVEIETDAEGESFAQGLRDLGCECALAGARRLKLVLGESTEVRDVYRVASERGANIRRLNYRRDSLEDIFLKAMENGATPPPLPVAGNGGSGHGGL